MLERAVHAVPVHHLPVGGCVHPPVGATVDVRIAVRRGGVRRRGNGGRQGGGRVAGGGGSGVRTANLKLGIGLPSADGHGGVVSGVVHVGDVALVLGGGREHAGVSHGGSCLSAGGRRRECTEGGAEARPMSLKAKGEVRKLAPRSSAPPT